MTRNLDVAYLLKIIQQFRNCTSFTCLRTVSNNNRISGVKNLWEEIGEEKGEIC